MNDITRKVVILDDELAAPKLERYSPSLAKALNDDTSPEFGFAKKYCIDTKILTDEDDIEKVIEFFQQELFLERIKDGGIQLFAQEYQEEFNTGIASHHEDTAIFSVLDSVFSDGWEVVRSDKRPDDTNQLRSYDVVVMDLMMGDEHDSVIRASQYLGRIANGGTESPPIFFLMSSRAELEAHRKIIRQHAHVGMGLFVLPKARLLRNDGANFLRVLLQYMIKSKGDADFLRQFCLNYEDQVKAAWHATREALWNMDFSYLQQIYYNTLNENQFFGDHVLDLLGYHHKNSIEQSGSIREKFIELNSLFQEKGDKFQSFSKDAYRSMHELETARHCVGIPSPIKIQYAGNTKFANRVQDHEVIRMLPFGAVIVKSGRIGEGAEGLIHITQECDLSRNVIKEKLSLVFLKVVFRSANAGREHPEAIPMILADGSPWCAEIVTKALIAKPAKEILGKFVREEFYIIAKLRPDLTRQLRGDVFHRLSRIERFIETGHKVFSVQMHVKIRVGKQTRQFTFNYDYGNQVIPREINVSAFSVEKKETYHLFGEDNYDAAFFIANLLGENNTGLDITVDQLEDVFRNQIPGKTKKITLPNNSNADVRAELHMMPTKKIEDLSLDKNGILIVLL